MSNLIYGRPTDNVTANATITASAADAAYPATNIKDLDPAKPSKMTTTTGNWVFDFGSAQRVDIIALIHHNLTAGLSVRIQGNATNVWTSPTLDQAIAIPTYHEDGFCVNPFLDLTGLAGYSVSGFRFWRLVVVGTNAANIAIGECVMLSLKRTLEINLSWGAEDTDAHPTIEHTTAYGVTRVYDLGVKLRALRGEIPDTTDVGLASLQALHRSAHGRAKPFLIVPDPVLNDAWMVRFDASTSTLLRTMKFVDVNRLAIGFDECGRGLPL